MNLPGRNPCLQLSFLILLSCVQSSPTEESSVEDKAIGDTQVAASERGVVVTAHPLATHAGVMMLEKGGNAFDAAVASAFALSVVEPSMSGLGGRMQAILQNVAGEIHGIDATTQAPMGYDSQTAPQAGFGYPTIGIPGVVKGLTTLLEDFGTLPLKIVMAPAIDYAENGYKLLYRAARRHGSAIKYIREFEGTSMYFLNGDTTHQENELFVQTDLANTLRMISENGPDVFYKGKIADKIIADIHANGGVIDKESLATYKAVKSKIVNGSYRGYDLHGLWMPSFGAITTEMLQILENLPISELSEAEWGSAVYQANILAYKDRWKQREGENADLLTSKAYAKMLADSITIGVEAMEVVGKIRSASEPGSWIASLGHTSHLSVADKDGNVIALTQSLGPNMGSKVVSPGLGFLYAATLGGYLGDFEPGQRASSHISPYIVTKDGKPFLILGAAGGSRIITAIVQVISRVIDRKMKLEDALSAGRVHAVDTAVLVETHEGSSWTSEDIKNLRELGLNVVEVDRSGRFGRVHAIYFDAASNQWTGVADPDWDGTALTPQK